MITQEELSNYLKFGFTESMSYNEPHKIDYNISFEECVAGYKVFYEEAMKNINLEGAICALSGGLDSSLNIFYIKNSNPLVYSYVIEGNLDHVYAEKLAKEWNLKRFFLIEGIDIDNLENLLIEMNRLWDKPRCVTGDLHTYDAYIKTREYSPLLLSGVGSEPMSLGIGWMYYPMIELALMKSEYDICLANEAFKKSMYSDPMVSSQFDLLRAIKNRHSTYSDIINSFGVFTPNEIHLMGLESPEIKLKEEKD